MRSRSYWRSWDREAKKRLRDALRGRTTPLSFREFVEKVSPGYVWYEHCVRLAAVLQRVADGELSRVMVFMPPRHGKSELASRLFPAYYLYRHPERWVGLATFGSGLSYRMSKAARSNYLKGGSLLARGSRQVKEWWTEMGGGFWASSVGGEITGKGWHLGVLDDPVKGAAQASSPKIREAFRDWYQSEWYTREEPGGAMVMILTRWDVDDPAGWQLQDEYERIADEDDPVDDGPERWHIVHFAAIKEEPGEEPEYPSTCTVEPDWREPGEALCPERAPLGRLRKIARKIGSYFWHALFQQQPRPRVGGYFRREWFEIVSARPADVVMRVRYWDLAATTDGDYTAGVLMSITRSGMVYVEDVVRGRWTPGARDAVIKQTAQLDGKGVRQIFEEEGGSAGISQGKAIVRMLAGFIARARRSTGSKAVRAEPFASQLEVGNVRLVEGPWNSEYIEEHCAFRGDDKGHDDQVDGSSGAYNYLTRGNRKPAQGMTPPDPMKRA